MHERTCPECGAAFEPRYGNQVCCSDECRKARHRRSDKESRRRARESKDKRALKNDALEAERAQLAQERQERRIRRRRADLAYKSLHVPVVTRTLDDGRVVETRGQRCIAPRICI